MLIVIGPRSSILAYDFVTLKQQRGNFTGRRIANFVTTGIVAPQTPLMSWMIVTSKDHI